MNLVLDQTERNLGTKQHKCRICGAEGEFQSYLTREMLYGTREEFEYFACPKCNCLQIAEIPADLGKYYPGGYYSFAVPTDSLNFPEEATDHTEILDVGCGGGKWLLEQAEQGYDRLFGCDPFIDGEKDYAGRVHIYKCSIHEIPGEKRFDLIRMADSLEHMEDPEAALKDARRLLKDDGKIEIIIPSWPNMAFDLFGPHWFQMDAPRHLWIPSVDTLHYLGDRTSLEIEETHCDSYEVAIMVSFFYQHGIPMTELTDDVILGLFSDEQRMDIRRTMYDANARGEGDHRVVTYRKKTDTGAGSLKKEFDSIDPAWTEYQISRAVEELVEQGMKAGNYDDCFDFLKWLFFEKEDVSKASYLSEGTMLQFIMLETALAERNRFTEEEFARENPCHKYDGDWRKFREAYIRIKHDIRRIWFAFSDKEKEDLVDCAKEYGASPELLAVLIKYCVTPDGYESVYEEAAKILEKAGRNTDANILRKYGAMAGHGDDNGKRLCFSGSESGEGVSKMSFRRLELKKNSPAADGSFLKSQKTDENKIAIIFCTHDEIMEQECLKYLQRLYVPEGMRAEILSVWNAKGMCYGYNRAMRETDAKYKIYLHHDSFLIKEDALRRTVELLNSEAGWKMLGIAGSTGMADDFAWAHSRVENLRYNLYQDKVLETVLSQSAVKHGDVEDAEAIDGVFIATSEDLPWREDLFDGWHFYDISQAFEFRNAGYRTGLINDEMPWMLHEITAAKDPEEKYGVYGRIFQKEYRDG